jgi:hypothetical protein
MFLFQFAPAGLFELNRRVVDLAAVYLFVLVGDIGPGAQAQGDAIAWWESDGENELKLADLCDSLLERARVAAAVENRQHPNFFGTDHIIDAVIPESADGSATHVGKTDAIQQRIACERANSAIYLFQEILSQPILALFVPEGGVENVLVSGRKPLENETHEAADALSPLRHPKIRAIQDGPTLGRGDEGFPLLAAR